MLPRPSYTHWVHKSLFQVSCSTVVQSLLKVTSLRTRLAARYGTLFRPSVPLLRVSETQSQECTFLTAVAEVTENLRRRRGAGETPHGGKSEA
jgi:hypothetical protein